MVVLSKGVTGSRIVQVSIRNTFVDFDVKSQEPQRPRERSAPGRLQGQAERPGCGDVAFTVFGSGALQQTQTHCEQQQQGRQQGPSEGWGLGDVAFSANGPDALQQKQRHCDQRQWQRQQGAAQRRRRQRYPSKSGAKARPQILTYDAMLRSGLRRDFDDLTWELMGMPLEKFRKVWMDSSLGSRVLQTVLERASSPHGENLAQRQLLPDISRAVEHSHGNFVIQAIVKHVEGGATLVAHALGGSAVRLSRHPYGCRILQRLLEASSADESVMNLFEEMLSKICDLVKDTNARYVFGVALECGQNHHVKAIVEHLSANLAELRLNKLSCYVVDKAERLNIFL